MGRRALPLDEKIRKGTVNWYLEKLKAKAEGRELQTTAEALAVAPEAVGRSYGAMAACYVDGVLSGRLVACRWVKLACARQRRDVERAETETAWPYVYDEAAAARACHFIEQLPHVEGRWASPLIVLEPWQVFLVSLLFGWRVAADRTRRRFTTFYLEVGRKAAKSTLMAAIAYYHLLREDEPGASVICAATTGQQARMVFGIMQKMQLRSPWLRAQGVQKYANSIQTPDGAAQPVNSKASSLDGLNPSCIVLDESHAQDFALSDVLTSAQGARGNPLMLCPTTAGYDLLSVGYAMHQQVEKILDGVYVAEHVLGAIYTLDDGDDWRDERVWIKANPMLGVSPTLEYVQRYCEDAQQVRGKEGEFRIKVCSQWVHAAGKWLDMNAWRRCADPDLRLETFLGQRCWIGADLAAVDDLTAVVLLFEEADRIVFFCRAYLPAGVVASRARAVPEYRVWAEDALLIETDGPMTDYGRVEADIRADCARFRVEEVVFDEFGSRQMAAALAADGITAVIQAKRAAAITPAALDLEARVGHQLCRHDGNSLLAWAAGNCSVTRRIDGSLLPKKEHENSPNKIDPIDALLLAMAARLRGQGRRAKDYQIIVVGGRTA